MERGVDITDQNSVLLHVTSVRIGSAAQVSLYL